MTLKKKLLRRRAEAKAPEPEAENPTNAIAKILNDASTAVSGAFREVVSMADDIHAIIVADEDEVKKKREEEEEKKMTIISKVFNTINVKRNISPAPSATSMKETNACEKWENEKNAEQPTSPNTEVKGSTATLLAKHMAKFDKTTKQIAKLEQQISKIEEEMVDTKHSVRALAAKFIALSKDKDRSEQPTSSNMELKGSPATLAKLMTNLEKKEKQFKDLKQQLSKAEVEAAETKESIDALTATFCSSPPLHVQCIGPPPHVHCNDEQRNDDGSSIWDDEQSDDDKQSQYGDDDQRQSDDESSIWDDEDGDDAIDTSFDFTSKSLMLISEKLNQAIYPGQ